MNRYDEIRERVKLDQQSCSHDPQPVAGMDYVKRCSACGKWFGRNEYEMIESKRKTETDDK